MSKDYRTGLLCIIGCQVFWGLCPIYWHALGDAIPSQIIILYRIVTMFIFSYAAARTQYSRKEIWEPFRDRGTRLRSFAAGLVLTANWSIYVWAITSGRVLQTAIGYYIEPIVICAVGIVFFREKLTKYNLTAIVFAAAAVLVILAHYRQLPGVALGLAGTWATYSAVKKSEDRPVLLALVYETVLYAVLALIAIIFIEAGGTGALSLHVPGRYAMMMFSGLITVIPVGLFAAAAKKVPLLFIGLTQYLSPTMTLILGVWMFKEPVDRVQILAFAIVWTGLIIFSIGEIRQHRADQKPSRF